MTLPRPVIPDKTSLITRRCIQRQFLLRPSPFVNQVILYCMGLAQQRSGVAIHSVCAMSSHIHITVTDSEGRLPEFEHHLNLLVAKTLNASRGRWGAMWEPESYSAVAIPIPNDVLGKCGYTLANPVSAGLVREGHQWPGVRLGPESWDREIVVKRPRIFFNDLGEETPDEVAVRLSRPAGFEHLDDGALRELLEQEVLRQEEKAREKIAREGRTFLGRRAVLDQSLTDSAQSWERRRKLKPRIACRDHWKRMEAIQRLQEFIAEYRQSWEAFRDGIRDVVFPYGTYALRIHLGVVCRAPP